jgi:hypothetical protein
VRFALQILAYNKISGLNDLFDIIRPKYLNSCTVSIFYLFNNSWPLQFTYIAYVFPMLMCRSLPTQKELKQSNSNYNSDGDGAIRTRSSAKASMNNYSDAIVYDLLLLPCMLRVL